MHKVAHLLVCIAGSAMLAGCFYVEDDETDPIIPDASMAYPLNTGEVQLCEEDPASSDDPDCAGARIERSTSGGYDFVTLGTDGEGETTKYRLRAVGGSGVPARTFLIQENEGDADARAVGLLKSRAAGGWIKTDPQCDKLVPEKFVEFINAGWIRSDGDELVDMTCYIKREGLDDSRLYAILDSAGSDSMRIIIEE